jgi:hypothetical protein
MGFKYKSQCDLVRGSHPIATVVRPWVAIFGTVQETTPVVNYCSKKQLAMPRPPLEI